jgi:hypothetical protein
MVPGAYRVLYELAMPDKFSRKKSETINSKIRQAAGVAFASTACHSIAGKAVNS